MSWVSENKFLTGFGVVMLAGVGTLGWFTWSAMDKFDASTTNFEAASRELTRLQQEVKPSPTDAHLKELLAQKDLLTERIGAFQAELKKRVLPPSGVPVEPAQFQDKLKDAVGKFAARAAAEKVDTPKNFYLGYERYQATPPPKAAATALARQLRVVELVLEVFVQTGGVEINEFNRGPLPEEGLAKADGSLRGPGSRRPPGTRSDQGPVERNELHIKFTSSDEALRRILTALANHKEQLFVVRNVAIQNKQAESPARLAAGLPFPPPPGPAGSPIPPANPPGAATAPGATVPDASAPGATVPGAPAPVAPPVTAPAAKEGSLSYVFGTEQIVSTVEIEVLSIVEPKPKAEKGDKKKNKEK